MKYVYLTLNWIFGVLFLLLGFVLLVNDLLTALPPLAISLLLLPTVRKFAYSKTNKEVPFKARAGVIFVLVMLFFVFMGQSANRELQKFANQQAQAEQARAEKQKHLAYFNANNSIILAEIRGVIEAKEYQKAISLSSKYLVVGNQELLALNGRAKEELAAAHKAEETEKLLSELKGIPTSEYENNLRLYQQLVTLNPNNQNYKSKVQFYTQKISERNARTKEELAAAHKAEETEKLLSELKNVPISEYENNLKLYQQLVTLNPNNQNYKSKVQFYTQKISERNEKQRLAAEQKKKLEVQKDTGGMVSKRSFNGVWPLTVKEGTLACNNNAVTFKTIDGKVYAVNGTATSRGAQEIDPIWKNNPDLPGTKLNISDLIKKGLSLCSEIGNETSSLASEQPTSKATKNWYEGGTLHHAKGKDWRVATVANRLATSADFIAKMSVSGKLNITIQEEGNLKLDDLKLYATDLSNCLTEFLKLELTDTQPVADSAVMCMIAMEWLK